MLRLIVLLLGSKPLRANAWLFLVLALLSAAAGVTLAANLFPKAVEIAVDALGVVFVAVGIFRLLRLASIGFPNASIAVLKALAFIALGYLTFDTTRLDGDDIATVVIGGALAVDGAFRILANWTIQSIRWRVALAYGFAEIAVAVLVWASWPISRENSVPFVLGLGLLVAALHLGQLAWQLRRIPVGASVTTLPLFSSANWLGRGAPHGLPDPHDHWVHAAPLVVHIWTPVGAAKHPKRQLLVDRYIAAVDQGGVISTGHAALSLPPDLYLSLVPADDFDHAVRDFRPLLRASAENNVAGEFKASFVDECAGWTSPDREIRFTRYNATATRAFASAYQRNTIYNLTSRNCSSTVALALDAAVEGLLGRSRPMRTMVALILDPHLWLLALWRARAEAMTWTPGLVADYATALWHVVEGRRQGWFVRLKAARERFEEGRRAHIAQGQSTKSQYPAMVSLIATATIFGLSYGLTAPLLALALTAKGFGEGFIGANAAMHAVGVLAIAVFLPRIAWRYGTKLPIATALLAAGATLALFPVMPWIWLWFPLRLMLGVASETLFVMSETWLGHLSREASRTRVMAIYTAALSLGFALGPIILTAIGPRSAAFIIGAGLCMVALASIAMPWVRSPEIEQPKKAHAIKYLWLAPVAVGATLLNAALETAGMSFLPLYAISNGWPQASATLLLSVLLVGAIVMQLPIGWLGDKMDKRTLLILLGAASAAGAAAWPLVFGSPPLAYGLLFLWGGLFVGIYTVAMAVVGTRFKGGDLASVYAIMSIAWGVGALIGPGAAGFAMELNTHGLAYFAAASCAAFTVVAVVFKEREA